MLIQVYINCQIHLEESSSNRQVFHFERLDTISTSIKIQKIIWIGVVQALFGGNIYFLMFFFQIKIISQSSDFSILKSLRGTVSILIHVQLLKC